MENLICIYQAQCAFFNKADKTSADITIREIYCFKAPKSREILKRSREGKSVPDTMLPDGTIEAREDSPKKTATIEGEIAYVATDQLKNNIAVIDELSIFKQDEIRHSIRNAAIRVLKQDKIDKKSAK